ncbi:hypothetical protein QJS66_11920 [Kocuria rhizophila]|nr:hypothetical protein QJS66_11920 [Kocuria rhizophila]
MTNTDYHYYVPSSIRHRPAGAPGRASVSRYRDALRGAPACGPAPCWWVP